jgi:uncharacterized protein YndB with AHSA1/START domain
MTARKSPIKKTAAPKIIITRVIKAPCQLVFKAWTDPRQMAQWWSPQDVECRSVSADLKIGGAYRIHMGSPRKATILPLENTSRSSRTNVFNSPGNGRPTPCRRAR